MPYRWWWCWAIGKPKHGPYSTGSMVCMAFQKHLAVKAKHLAVLEQFYNTVLKMVLHWYNAQDNTATQTHTLYESSIPASAHQESLPHLLVFSLPLGKKVLGLACLTHLTCPLATLRPPPPPADHSTLGSEVGLGSMRWWNHLDFTTLFSLYGGSSKQASNNNNKLQATTRTCETGNN